MHKLFGPSPKPKPFPGSSFRKLIYTYKVESLSWFRIPMTDGIIKQFQAYLNDNGREGWTLDNILMYEDRTIMIFIKPTVESIEEEEIPSE